VENHGALSWGDRSQELATPVEGGRNKLLYLQTNEQLAKRFEKAKTPPLIKAPGQTAWVLPA